MYLTYLLFWIKLLFLLIKKRVSDFLFLFLLSFFLCITLNSALITFLPYYMHFVYFPKIKEKSVNVLTFVVHFYTESIISFQYCVWRVFSFFYWLFCRSKRYFQWKMCPQLLQGGFLERRAELCWKR